MLYATLYEADKQSMQKQYQLNHFSKCTQQQVQIIPNKHLSKRKKIKHFNITEPTGSPYISDHYAYMNIHFMLTTLLLFQEFPSLFKIWPFVVPVKALAALKQAFVVFIFLFTKQNAHQHNQENFHKHKFSK